MSSTLRFAAAVRSLSAAARSLGLTVPTFRAPPGVRGAARTIRRTPRGATVAVVVAGRPWSAVLADCVDGVLVANGLDGADAVPVRTALWAALERDAPAAA